MHHEQQPAYPTAQPQGRDATADAEHACSTEAGDAHTPAPGSASALNSGHSIAQGQAASPQPGAQAGMYGNPQGQAYPQSSGNSAPSQTGMAAWGYPVQPGAVAQPGPNMGQPHFSSQFPGAAPYQGAPMAGGNGVQGQAYGQQGAQPGMAQPAGFPQQPLGQAGYAHPVNQFPPQPGPGATAHQYPGQQPYPVQAAPSPGRGQENRYGELYGLIQEAANGNADVSGFLRFFQSTSSDFWKGALVGTGLTLLLTSDAAKSAISKGVAGVFGLLGKSAEDMEAEEDRKAEQRAAKEQ